MKRNVIILISLVVLGTLIYIFRDPLKKLVGGLFDRLKNRGSGSDAVIEGVPYDAVHQSVTSGNSVAERNNNPGNIRDFGDAWQGLDGAPKADGSFCKFTDQSSGARAMVKLVLNKVRQGYNTVSKLINNYAPAADNNNPASYAHIVASALQVSPDAPLSVDDREFIAAVAYRMHIVEAGYPWVPFETFLSWANTL
jgi:hypothetical protein